MQIRCYEYCLSPFTAYIYKCFPLNVHVATLMTAIRQVSSSAQESGISFKEYGKHLYCMLYTHVYFITACTALWHIITLRVYQ